MLCRVGINSGILYGYYGVFWTVHQFGKKICTLHNDMHHHLQHKLTKLIPINKLITVI